MDNSIRDNVKQLLGVPVEVLNFDIDITLAINTALMELNQLGIGPEAGFVIAGSEETWVDLLGEKTDLEAVKTFVYLKTKQVFDPPPTSYQVEAIERTLKELSWRLINQVEHVIDTEVP